MRIIVSDTSALIDLRKGALIEALLHLPHEVQIRDLLLEDELPPSPRLKSELRAGKGCGSLRSRRRS